MHRSRTQSWDGATELTSAAYFPHRLVPKGHAAPDFRIAAVDYGPVTIGRVSFGAELAIECEYPGAIEINFPLVGAVESRLGSAEFGAARGQATIFDADQRHDITRWTTDCEVIAVKFDAAWLREQAARGFDAGPGLQLPHQLDLRRASTADWFRLLRGLHSSGVSGGPVAPMLADAVATSFLLASLPDPDHGRGVNDRTAATVVRPVLEALAADPGRNWTALEMAEIGQVSIRRLQEAFRKTLGQTPRQKLLELRLEHARAQLRAGRGSVTEISADLGFSNPGRFAAAYRRRWGVLPSEDVPRWALQHPPGRQRLLTLQPA
ncbi:AraC family transcriptional regulator [Granulicoccus phenolivorans]|uniref:AraC family transcriptional regulator n=1 Tax=Granulicoccus phenolivorans TaxID=266854 RepID=UPI000411E921|nr:AraC family transcriptional regulator [Granulicoccus phenolivorans]